MATLKSEGILCVFLIGLFVSAAFASGDAPFIVANKKVSLTRLKSGAEKVDVSIDVYNKGSETAYDVSLIDDSWAPDVFDVVSGNTSKTWDRLDIESKVSHSFVLESKVKGLFYGAPAVIKYRVPSKAALQEAYSTPILPLDILAERPPEKKFEIVKRLLAKYGSLVSVLSIVALFIIMITRPTRSGAGKGSKKRR
ncbi:hypothetical protein H6P81_000129 [Aristolochia fimbriata]|uniref:Translocon-associated protein subunit beta n=1 Tax=Aristolochia fimbriata TaxID=158543 RepID=A0AAV7F670_ARIFI|nr:hypothetical protein H6P81_000129 [Aristolochia fimbriata]